MWPAKYPVIPKVPLPAKRTSIKMDLMNIANKPTNPLTVSLNH